MLKNLPNLILTIILLTNLNCGQTKTPAETDPAYVAAIQKWQQKRTSSLTRKNGWLCLAGLLWLEEGENRFGSHATNSVRFPEGQAPNFIGTFMLEKGEVRVTIDPGIKVLCEEKPVQKMLLKTDLSDEKTILSLGTLSWYIIKRGDRFGVRLRDSEHANLRNFKDIDAFEIDPAWRIKAKFEPYVPVKKIPIPNVLGSITDERCPGALVFEVDGNMHRLDVLADTDEDDFFMIFADKTSGYETYGAGRFLYVEKPGEDGTTFIDFNKAYNPPCAFTEFATCPLPPSQNRLPVNIMAGEKKYAGGSH